MNSCSNRPDRRAEISRTQGCLLGQLAGNALGSLVEFQTPEQIRQEYPGGIRDLADGGTWNTIAGQPTDDFEMALLLARLLADQRKYDPEEAGKAYVFWLDSGPFDCGHDRVERPAETGQSGKPGQRGHDAALTHPIKFAGRPMRCSRKRRLRVTSTSKVGS